MKTGIFPLLESDKLALAEHFVRLPAMDRRFRFGVAMSDERLTVLSGQMQPRYMSGYFIDGRLIAVSFLAPECPERSEFAVSVDEAFRGMGIAQQLLEHALSAAAYRNTKHIVVRRAVDNAPMARLCARFSPSRRCEGSDVEETLDPVGLAAEHLRAHELLCAAEA